LDQADTLAAGEFIRRSLLHVLPSGLHRIWHGIGCIDWRFMRTAEPLSVRRDATAATLNA